MAKTMAVLKNGTVTNVVWCSNSQGETDNLKNPGERPVGIGDTYGDGKFYREGVEVLTPLEEAYRKLDALEEAYREGVNSL